MTRIPIRLAFWLKWHWPLLRWLPYGGRVWRMAVDTVDQWHEAKTT